MDPLRIALRAATVYVLLLGLLRLAGKRTIRHGSSFDFVMALVLGDLVDDAVWGDVPMAQFTVAAAALLAATLAGMWHRARPQSSQR